MPSNMQYDMSRAPTIKAPRAHFNRSHRHLTAIDYDYLYPCYHDFVYPGDTFSMNTQMFARLATPKWPIMDNHFVTVHYFFIPMRLLWTNARKFWGEQEDPGDSISFTIPQMAATASTGYSENSLDDYLGLPTKVTRRS